MEHTDLTKALFTRNRLLDFKWFAGLLPNPDPVLRKRGMALEVYRNLTADPRVAACLESRISGVLSWEWSIDAEADRDRDAARQILEDLAPYTIMAQMLEAVFFGYKPVEIIWGKRSVSGRTLVVPVELRGLPPEWFAFDADGRPRFLSRSSVHGEAVPERKLLMLTHDADYANPYGRPVGGLCFWPVTFKRAGTKFWASFVERYGMPYLVGKVPTGTPNDKKQQVADQLERMVQDAIAVLEDDHAVSTLDVGTRSASSDLYLDLIRHANDEIAVAILGQTLTTDVREGSYAAAKVHMEVREDLSGRDRRMIQSAFNTILQWTWAVNFTGKPPRWLWVEEDDAKREWAERDDILAKHLRLSKAYYMRRYGFTEDDIEGLAVGWTESAESQQGLSGLPAPAEPPHDLDQAAVDALADAMRGETFAAALAPIVEAVKASTSYHELMERLYDLHKDMDTADFQELLRRAMFAADLWGYVRTRDDHAQAATL